MGAAYEQDRPHLAHLWTILSNAAYLRASRPNVLFRLFLSNNQVDVFDHTMLGCLYLE